MGTLSAPSLTSKPDAKVTLIERIVAKTREGKFLWERTPGGYKGYTPDRTITASLTPGLRLMNEGGWSKFTVQSQGEEILNYENSLTLLTLSGLGRGTATEKIDELAAYLEERGLQSVRSAIDALNRL